jgi:endonuclease/exonuclease/phosphatase family metal-dependent hydrolase
MAVRIATFNAENLFNRAKVLNLKDNERITDKLERISELQKLIEKDTYTAADKTKILALYHGLKDYISIEADRGKLMDRNGTRVTAAGAKSWDGGIVFKRAKFSDQQREVTGRVIKELKADVLCAIEVEDRLSLERFDTDVLNNRYKQAMLIDGNDPRGIDVGLYSNFPITNIRTHIYDRSGSSKIFSRDCPEYEVALPGGKSLTVLPNHLKSKGYGEPAASNAKRKRQAERIAELLQDYDLSTDYVVVAGDLNDTPGSAPLAPLLGVPGLSDVLELQFGNTPADRWTYWFRGSGNQIDYLLISDALKAKFRSAGLERRGIYNVDNHTGGAIVPFAGVTSSSTAASDHAAVFADFDL